MLREQFLNLLNADLGLTVKLQVLLGLFYIYEPASVSDPIIGYLLPTHICNFLLKSPVSSLAQVSLYLLYPKSLLIGYLIAGLIVVFLQIVNFRLEN